MVALAVPLQVLLHQQLRPVLQGSQFLVTPSPQA
jgi:hypothetical protein